MDGRSPRKTERAVRAASHNPVIRTKMKRQTSTVCFFVLAADEDAEPTSRGCYSTKRYLKLKYDDKYDDVCNNCNFVRDVPMRPISVVGIVTGTTVATAMGVFSIIWFVIQKKSWADFLAIFKK